MTQPEWDDDRLDAAFRERFDRPAPAGLDEDIRAGLTGTSPARFAAFRRDRAGWTLAAAAVVVVLIGAVTVNLGGFGRAAGSPPPSETTVPPSQGPSATPTAQAVPGSIFGLPIIHVPDAIAIRDAGVDDREIAVQGWFRPAPLVSCPLPATPVSPPQLHCPDDLSWLMRDLEPGAFAPPVGPSLNPDLDGLDTSWEPVSPQPGVANGVPAPPVDVVFVGHFDDRRAALCPAAEQIACRDRLVVDSVALIHGVPTGLVPVFQNVQPARSTAADIEAIVANQAPQSPILSMTVIDGRTDLGAIEPSLGLSPRGLGDQPTVWIVRVLESERVSTYLIVDGSDAIYQMNPEGQAILVGGTPPTPGASPSAALWPPVGAPVISLTSEFGAGKPPVRVAVVDHSGRLTGVAEKGSRDPSTMTLDQPIEAYPELDVSPGRIHLVWLGGICDSQITVAVAADVKTITFDMGPRPACDSIGVERQLVLDFSGLLDVPSITLVDAATGVVSSPGASPVYALDCGPLGADTCDAKAADVVAATPSQRVVAIAFSDECGSYRVTFDDGTWTTANRDCAAPGPS